MMGWYSGGWGWAGMLGMASMVLLWGGVIWLAVWAIARTTRTDQAPPVTPESARAVLDRRFASGDIDIEEYARRRHALESPGSADAART